MEIQSHRLSCANSCGTQTSSFFFLQQPSFLETCLITDEQSLADISTVHNLRDNCLSFYSNCYNTTRCIFHIEISATEAFLGLFFSDNIS